MILEKKNDNAKKVALMWDELYNKEIKPLLETRTKLVKANMETCPGFWRTTLCNAGEHFGERIEEWDEEILDHLIDITVDYLDKQDHSKGFRLTFHFSENDWFENKTLTVKFDTEKIHEYTEDIDIVKISMIQGFNVQWLITISAQPISLLMALGRGVGG